MLSARSRTLFDQIYTLVYDLIWLCSYAFFGELLSFDRRALTSQWIIYPLFGDLFLTVEAVITGAEDYEDIENLGLCRLDLTSATWRF